MVEREATTDIEALERLVVDNEDLERLEELTAEFNLFEAIGAVRQELRHSDTLRFLLDPSSPHGFGDAFLARFLKGALAGNRESGLGPVEIDVADLSDTEVQREWRRIDILLRNRSANFVVAIENKVDTGEHSDQLRRYREILEKEFPTARRVYLFLTPEGTRPSDDAWLTISYDFVAETVGAVAAAYASRSGPDVLTLVNHYLTLLRRYIVSDSDIAQLCRQIYKKHRQALDLIFEHRPDSHSRQAEMVKGLIADAADAGIVPDRMGKSNVNFALAEWDARQWQQEGIGWTKSNRVLLFEFQITDKASFMILYVGPAHPATRQAFFTAFCEPKPKLPGGASKITKAYTRVYRKKWFDIEATEELLARLEKKWRAFLKNDVPDVRKIVDGFEWEPPK